MTSNDYNNKFLILREFKEKLPGIFDGFELLNKLIARKSLVESRGNGIFFYNYLTNTIEEHSILILNKILQEIYNEHVTNIISSNNLYKTLSFFIEKLIKKNNFKYKDDNNLNKFMTRFFHGLRVSITLDVKQYLLSNVLIPFEKYQCLDISNQQFKIFYYEILRELSNNNVLIYDIEKNRIFFHHFYEQDLILLINFNFEMLLLGEFNFLRNYKLDNDIRTQLNQLYSSYSLGDNHMKSFVKNISLCLVICCSVDTISVLSGTNNVFIDYLIYFNVNENKNKNIIS